MNFKSKRIIVLYDVDNQPANTVENLIPIHAALAQKIRRIGHINEFHLFTSNKNYISDMDVIINHMMVQLNTYSYRFSKNYVEPNGKNATDNALIRKGVHLQHYYFSRNNWGNISYVFIIVSGDSYFFCLKISGDVFQHEVKFFCSSNVRSKQLDGHLL